MSSSTTTALSRQPLAQVLRNLTYPRDRRGVRHDLPTVLSLAVTGVLASCRSLTAIWEHTTDLTAADLEALGLQVGQALPSESTIRRVLQDLDPTDLDTHVRSWFCTRTGTITGRTVIAVDGKTMRGARTGKDPAPHLLAALDQATGHCPCPGTCGRQVLWGRRLMVGIRRPVMNRVMVVRRKGRRSSLGHQHLLLAAGAPTLRRTVPRTKPLVFPARQLS